MSATIHYRVEGFGHDATVHQCECDRLPVGDIVNLELVAEQCAADWHHRNGGWGIAAPLWPAVPLIRTIRVVVLTPEGDELGRCDVVREPAPVFRARRGQWVDVTEPATTPERTE